MEWFAGGFAETDQAKEFNTLNSAYHPVEDVGKNPVPEAKWRLVRGVVDRRLHADKPDGLFRLPRVGDRG